MLSLLAVSWEESSIPHLATCRFMHADDNNTQYKMVSMVKHFLSSIFPTKWLPLDLFNMAITCQRMGKKKHQKKKRPPADAIHCLHAGWTDSAFPNTEQGAQREVSLLFSFFMDDISLKLALKSFWRLACFCVVSLWQGWWECEYSPHPSSPNHPTQGAFIL